MSAVRQGGPPAKGRPAITLAEHLHLARKRVLENAARAAHGYKHLVCKRLSISRPHLDKWIALYGIREQFRHNSTRWTTRNAEPTREPDSPNASHSSQRTLLACEAQDEYGQRTGESGVREASSNRKERPR